MGALRMEIIDCRQQGGVTAALHAFQVILDCWQVSMWVQALPSLDTVDNWLVNGTPLGAFLMGRTDVAGSPATGGAPVTWGGFIHQKGGRGLAGNFNQTLQFQPVNINGEVCALTIVKVYYDEGLTDPDFPG